MKPSRVFLDHNATTPPSKEVLEFLKDFSSWGNPSSIHGSGRAAKAEILKTRRALASYLNVSPGELIFTSGGSESNNFAIKGLLKKLKERGQTKLLASAVEHPSVLKTLEQVKSYGFEVVLVPVSKSKGFCYETLSQELEDKKIGLVSVMFANNETGEVFDLKKISEKVQKASLSSGQKIYFHSDMVQSLGKHELDFLKCGVDLASFSSHKFYALQGSGVLYQKKGVGLENLISGGGQERGRRAGTENLLSIASLGVQVEKLSGLTKKLDVVKDLRDFMESEIKSQIQGVEVLAESRTRLSNTSLILIDGVHGENLLMNLDLKGFEVSTGAACSSGNPEPSPVLLSMGMSPKEASKSLRLSLGWSSTREEVLEFTKALVKVVKKLRDL